MHRRTAGLVAIAAVLVGLWAQPLPAQNLAVSFIEELRIGDDETKPLAYLLGSPDELAVDAEGRIYVSDRQLKEIRVFDADGNHVTTIGREGQGPGEFREISTMAIDRDGSLLVMDAMNQRMSRVFGLGERFESVKWPGRGWGRADQIVPYGNRYLMLYSTREPGSPHHGRLFHLHSSDLTRVEASFGKADLFFDLREPIERVMAQMGLAQNVAAVDDADRVYFARGSYDGTVYRLTKNDDDVWRVDPLRGLRTDHPPYRAIEIATFRNEQPPNSFASFSSEGEHAGVMYNASNGLHVAPDGSVLHFFRMPPDGDVDAAERVMVVEQFDRRGRYLGYGLFDPASIGSYVKVAAQDADGRLYLIEFRDDQSPIVRRVRLEIKPASP